MRLLKTMKLYHVFQIIKKIMDLNLYILNYVHLLIIKFLNLIQLI